MNAHELFPPIMCRGCGKHGLTIFDAKAHLGTGRHYCRGGDAKGRDQSCALCGESFIEDGWVGIVKPRKRKIAWRGREIYEHKMQHLRDDDEQGAPEGA